MTGVTQRIVSEAEAGQRLDRWFKRLLPGLNHAYLEKLLRTGQIRVDGGRAKASDRLAAGQVVRVPPIPDAAAPAPSRRPAQLSEQDRRYVRSLILFENAHLLVLNKPAGLAVQGGTKTARHLDALLGGLTRSGEDRPRLVHRLDRDTSGVLVLARSLKSATHLAEAFRTHRTEKIYWALTAGVPSPPRGRIDLPLTKGQGLRDREIMVPARPDDEGAQRAITDYEVLAHAGGKVALVALRPLTGRTHQLRVHLAALGVPILGDTKYGKQNIDLGTYVPKGLQLHARRLSLRDLSGQGHVFTAPVPAHMAEAFAFFGFEPREAETAFTTVINDKRINKKSKLSRPARVVL